MAVAASTTTFEGIRSQISKRQLAPVYLLHGEEGYFIDLLAKAFEELIPEADRDFNLYTLYAPQVDVNVIIDTCRRYPMMADFQIVIVKEAQAVNATILNKLQSYVAHPSPSTVLVICCRGAKAKGSELIKAIKASGGVIFESPKLKEANVAQAISRFIKDKGLNIESKGLAMLRDYVGSDLSRLYNEIDKLTVALPANSTVTPEVIERHIGVSKDYNNFELVSALARRDALHAFTIVEYFRSNPKNNPLVVTIGTLWNFFSNLLLLHYSKDKSDSGLCAEIGLKWSRLPDDYRAGQRNYSARRLVDIMTYLREADCQSKGIGSRVDQYDALHDLVFKILAR